MKAEDMFIALSKMESLDDAKSALATFYVPDMMISRSEICRVIKMLETHFATKQN